MHGRTICRSTQSHYADQRGGGRGWGTPSRGLGAGDPHQNFSEKSPLQIRERGRNSSSMGICAKSKFHCRRGISELLRDTTRCHLGVENKTAWSISSEKQSECRSHSKRRSNSKRMNNCQSQFGDFTDHKLYLIVWVQFEFFFEEDSWSDMVSFYWSSLRPYIDIFGTLFVTHIDDLINKISLPSAPRM